MKHKYTISCDLSIESNETLTEKEIEKYLNIIIKNPSVAISNVMIIDVND